MPRTVLALACALLSLAAAGSAAAQTPVTGVDLSCFAAAGNPEPGSPEWMQRDLDNQRCASLRPRDQLANPAFGFGNQTQGVSLYGEQTEDELSDPTRP